MLTLNQSTIACHLQGLTQPTDDAAACSRDSGLTLLYVSLSPSLLSIVIVLPFVLPNKDTTYYCAGEQYRFVCDSIGTHTLMHGYLDTMYI